MMKKISKFSYSFSFSKNTCDNLRYYKKTNNDHLINNMSEKFILSFIKNSTKTLSSKEKRRYNHKNIQDVCVPFSFSFLKSTIHEIQEFKKSSKYSLDEVLENHLNLQIPVRVV